MAKYRNRKRRPARAAPSLDPKPLILIVCEGKNTEPQYFEAFRDACENPRVSVEIEPEAGVPKTVVDFAKRRKLQNVDDWKREKDDNVLFDEIWCVFDVDNHPGLNDAIIKARDNDLKLAISNEAFELWLLLHFRENPGMRGRESLKSMVKKYVRGYDKKIVIDKYLPGYHDAVRRASKMWDDAKLAGERWDRNPVTNVFELTEKIRGGSEFSINRK